MIDRLKLAFMIFVVGVLFTFQPCYADVLYRLDFTEMKDGDAVKWFKKEGFVFKRDGDEVNLQFNKNRLIIENPKEINGLITKQVEIKNAKRIRIEWGVSKYPQGANWEKGILREAIGFVITFGDEKISSGSFVVPDVPYFIELFLGELEVENKVYTGNYYKKGGRYICTPCKNKVDETIVTDFELKENFSKFFKESVVPPITGLTIETDTRDTEGLSKAFIKKIEIFSD
ncbi:hypothetical protein KKA14_15180 [bacterium]|nr:hypothetical protein [bacterium]